MSLPPHESILNRFEDAWQTGPPPRLEDFLNGDNPGRLSLLTELAHIDLECRLKAGQEARVEDYLQTHPELANERAVVLELLAAEWELRRRRQPGLGVEEYRRRFPDFAAQLEARFLPATLDRLAADADATLDRTAELGLSADSATASVTEDGSVITTSSHFVVRQLHARGGIGEILLATEEELQRDVAVKRMQDQQARHAESRRRFLWEAQVTSRLDHPGVVPVYGLGRAPDGSPIYAMRFIRGETLQQAVERFHALPTETKRSERNRTFRQLLGRYVSVCYTIAYAHNRGVLHRDLKPGNIMLGPYGETLVVDWGLAKALNGQGGEPTDPAPLVSPSRTADTATQMGTVVGTPAYMSPEQAEGRQDLLGPACDIYSLGATLYHLLTGQPPFPSGDAAEVLKRVRSGQFEPPRQVRRESSRPLEAICLRAMARSPTGRYATALDLAHDVEQWLSDEPVSAWKEPIVTRVFRWVSRHRTLVTATAATVFVAVVSLAIATALLTQANVAKEQARHDFETKAIEATGNLARADRNFYWHRISLADRELAANNVSRAGQRLAECAEDLRGWEWHLLRRRCRAFTHVLRGHQDVVWTVALRPDGREVATGSVDRTIKIWDTESGALLRTLEGHQEAVWGVAYSPDGRHLASASGDKTVRIWDPASGVQLRSLLVGREVRCVAYSPNGEVLAAGTDALMHDAKPPDPGLVKLWSAETGEAIREWALTVETDPNLPSPARDPNLPRAVEGLAFHPRGDRLATAGSDSLVKVWEVASGKLRVRFPGHRGPAYKVAYSPDGKLLASTSMDQRIGLWNAETGQLVGGRPLVGHLSATWGVAFSPDGERLATSSDDRTIHIWDVAQRRTIQVLQGHTLGIAEVVFSRDGKQLASAGDDWTACLWKPETHQAISNREVHPGRQIWSVAFHPGGQQLVASGDAAELQVWETAGNQPNLRVRAPLPFEGQGMAEVAYSPNGSLLAAACDDGTVRLWEAETARVKWSRPAHEGITWALAFHPRGHLLASAGADGRVVLRDAATGDELHAWDGQARFNTRIAFSPDGQLLAAASADNGVCLWNVETRRLERKLSGHTNEVLAIAFHPNGKVLASCSREKPIGATSEPSELKLWDVETGRELRSLHGSATSVSALAYSSDGQRLASASSDGSVTLWEPTTGQEILTLRTQAGHIRRVAFSPDNRLLAAACGNGSVLLLDGSPKKEP